MLNNHYAEVKPKSDAWLRGVEGVDVSSQKSFDLCDFRQLTTCFQISILVCLAFLCGLTYSQRFVRSTRVVDEVSD